MAAMEKTRHPGIFKRGSRYVVAWRDQNGRQRKQSCATLAEARKEKGRRDSGDRTAIDRTRFDDYAREWIDSYAGRTGRGLASRTRAAYRRAIIGRAIPFFGRRKLGEIEPPDIRRFIAGMEREGLAPSTIRGEVAPLRAMFATAVEDGQLRANPTVAVRINGRRVESDVDDRPRALTLAELSGLLGEVSAEWRPFYELLAQTGLRVSEAIGLRWDAVEFGDRPRIHVKRQCIRGEWSSPKTAASKRRVPLSPSTARRLWRLRGTSGPDALVFSTAAGTPLDDGNMRRRVLKPAAVRAGLTQPPETWADAEEPESWVGFHTFRHTCASLLFDAGKNVKQVQEWLGHTDPGFTLSRYVHLMDDGLGDVAFLDDLTAKGGNKVATRAPETGRNRSDAQASVSAA